MGEESKQLVILKHFPNTLLQLILTLFTSHLFCFQTEHLSDLFQHFLLLPLSSLIVNDHLRTLVRHLSLQLDVLLYGLHEVLELNVSRLKVEGKGFGQQLGVEVNHFLGPWGASVQFQVKKGEIDAFFHAQKLERFGEGDLVEEVLIDRPPFLIFRPS